MKFSLVCLGFFEGVGGVAWVEDTHIYFFSYTLKFYLGPALHINLAIILRICFFFLSFIYF